MRAASAIIRTLQVALRAEVASTNIRKASQRGRLSKLARDSIGLSLVAIEQGSGVMVFEPDTASLIDLPSQVFKDLIAETRREGGARHNAGIQKAILSLAELFQNESTIESIEFIDAQDNAGTVNPSTIERIRLVLSEPADTYAIDAHDQVTGRLLELDLVNRSFEVHSAHEKTVVGYDDFLEPLVMSALKRFIVAGVQKGADGRQTLLSVATIDDIPDSRFGDVRTIGDVISEQQLEPIVDFSSLAMEGLDAKDKATPEEFRAFIRSARHDDAC
jgi:voltage-gated potassium channel Kch